MSGTLTPMGGMGSNGATLGSPSMLTPAMIQMLMARSGVPTGATPLAQGQIATPMSMAMQHAMGGAMGPMPQMPSMQAAQQAAMQHGAGAGAAGILGALGNNPQLMQQLMQMFRGAQSGVNPFAGAVQNGFPVPPPSVGSTFIGAGQ